MLSLLLLAACQGPVDAIVHAAPAAPASIAAHPTLHPSAVIGSSPFRESTAGAVAAWSGDGERLIVGSLRTTAWNVKSGLRTWATAGAGVTALATAADLTFVGDDRGRIRLVGPDGQVRRTLIRHMAPITLLVVDRAGRTLASADENGDLRVWDLGTGAFRSLQASEDTGDGVTLPAGKIGRMLLSPDGARLAVAYADQVALWDLTGAKPPRLIECGELERIQALAWDHGKLRVGHLPDSDVGTGPLQVSTWDPGTGARTGLRAWSPGDATVLGFSDAVDRVVVLGEDAVHVVDAETGKRRVRLEDPPVIAGPRGSVVEADGAWFSPDGRFVLVTGPWTTLRVYDTATGRLVRQPTGHDGIPATLAVSRDGGVASASEGDAIHLWDKEGAEIATLPCKCREVAFSPDGSRLGAVETDGTVFLVSLTAPQTRLGRMDLADGYVHDTSIAWSGSSGGQPGWLAATGADGAVRRMDANGRTLAPVLFDAKVAREFLTTDSPAEVRNLHTSGDGLYATDGTGVLAFSPDLQVRARIDDLVWPRIAVRGDGSVVVADDKHVAVHAARDLAQIRRLDLDRVDRYNLEADGDRVVWTDAKGHASLWDTAGLHTALIDEPATASALSAGRWYISQGDGTIAVYDLADLAAIPAWNPPDRAALPTPAGPAGADLHGDPLPPGAALRLGTTRFNAGRDLVHVTWAQDGRVWTVDEGGKTIAWDPDTGEPTLALPLSVGTGGGFSWSDPAHPSLALGTNGMDATLWEVPSGRARWTWDPKGYLYNGVLGPKGTLAAVADAEGVTLLDGIRGVPLRTLVGAPGEPKSMAWTTGPVVAKKGFIGVWDATTGARTAQAECADVGSIMATKDTLVAQCGAVTTLRDPRTLALRRSIPTKPTQRVALSPDGQTLATTHSDGVTLWDVGTGSSRAEIGGRIKTMAFSPDGTRLSTAGVDHRVRLWDLDGHEVAAYESHGDAGPTRITWLGERVVTGAADYIVRVWDARGALLSHFRGSDDFALLPDGTLLTREPWPVAWDPLTGVRKGEIEIEDISLDAAFALSPDGKTLLGSTYQGGILLVDAGTGKVKTWLGREDGAYIKVGVWSADGRRVATGDDAGVVRVFDVDAAMEITALRADDAIESLALLPDRVLWSTHYGHGQSWGVVSAALRDGAELWTIPSAGRFALSPDGTRLAVVAEKDVELWRMDDQVPVSRIPGVATALGWSHDGRRLGVGYADGTVLIWDVTARR